MSQRVLTLAASQSPVVQVLTLLARTPAGRQLHCPVGGSDVRLAEISREQAWLRGVHCRSAGAGRRSRRVTRNGELQIPFARRRVTPAATIRPSGHGPRPFPSPSPSSGAARRSRSGRDVSMIAGGVTAPGNVVLFSLQTRPMRRRSAWAATRRPGRLCSDTGSRPSRGPRGSR